MSYIDAFYDKKTDKVRVVERNKQGERQYIDYDADHHFYITHPQGTHKTIYGTSVKKIVPSSAADKDKLVRMYNSSGVWESDIDPVLRTLENEYLDSERPTPNVAFFDIETDFDKNLGYSAPEDALNPIISIAIYLQWEDTMICLAVPPKNMSHTEANKIADEVGDTYICKTEAEMLRLFIEVVEDADILSGWNSEFYDIPYTINRIIKILGKTDTRKLCLWGLEPRKKKALMGKKEIKTYDLRGRIHLDYLALYKKYTYEERHSYSLDAIANAELGKEKVPYDGTLDQLYNNDFKKFLEYNIQDTKLLDDLDKKLKYIDLAKTITHGSAVLLPSAMGTVTMTDMAVIIQAHKHGLVVHNKEIDRDEKHTDKAAGGWVAWPKKGMHRWVGSADLASLYPSVIRSLNMSPETIIGQIRPLQTEHELDKYIESGGKFSTWWNDRFNIIEMDCVYDRCASTEIIVDFESGESLKMTGAELHNFIYGSENLCISANGTIFETQQTGIVPELLTRWFSERKKMKKQKAHTTLIKTGEIETDKNVDVSKITKKSKGSFYNFDYNEMLEALEDEERAIKYMSEWGLTIDNGYIIPNGKENLAKWLEAEEYWDKQQLVKKINLNSVYGGLLNKYCRFNDSRIGQSTTLTGRTITKHMTAKINEIITGKYDHEGEAVIYGDTDSSYYSAYPLLKEEIDKGEIEWNKDTVIELYDNISQQMDKTFPEFLKEKLNVPENKSKGVVTAEREIVGTTGIFIKKKRYAILVYDDEGERKDVEGNPGKIKAMGVEIRRSDTPKFVQNFLSEILLDALTEKGEDYVIDKITEFKEYFNNLEPWKKGTPKSVNNVTKYTEILAGNMSKTLQKTKKDKTNLPGHVRAALNWNRLRSVHQDHHSMKIVDGQKVAVCRLKETNNNTMHSIAYPVDESRLPDWFKNLPFDEDFMMERLVDMKVKNLFGVLGWDLSRASKSYQIAKDFFDFD